MSMEDRDWYREDFQQRRAQAESQARPGWNQAEGRANGEREPIPLNLTPLPMALPLKSLGLVLVFGVLALTVIRSEHGQIAWPTVHRASRPPPQEEAVVPVAFPENGSTTLTTHGLAAASAPLTLQTSSVDADLRYVVTARDWITNRLLATIYLEANSVTTVPLPAGDYRLIVASGHVWGGDAVLFGQTTQVMSATKPVRLVSYLDHSVGQVIYLMATANPNYPTEPVSSRGFFAR
jgi:hypothetical protein